MKIAVGVVLLLAIVLVAVWWCQPEPTGEACSVCGMVDCTMGCKAEGTDAAGGKAMVMPGLPDWLFYVGVAGVLAVSFVAAEVVGRREPTSKRWRFDVLAFVPPLKWFLKKPWSQFVLQLPMAILFLALIYMGLFGHQRINIVPLVTWTIWWAGLICLVLLFGKVWCLICPWDLMATVTAKLRLWGAGPGPLNLGLKWPRWLSNIAMAIVLFIVLTWLELGYHITRSPKYTAYMAIGILLLTMAPALIFERKSYCRHGCFVGRITGLYSTFSPVEIRATDKGICKACRIRDCYRGNDKGNPCPTGLSLATLEDNTYCLKCCECIRSCPHDNVSINLRPPAEDLYNYSGPRLDEAILAIVLLSLTSFHGLTMTPLWDNPSQPAGTVVGWISATTGTGQLTSFTIGMAAVLAGPVLLYLGFCLLARGMAKYLARGRDLPFGKVSVLTIFIQFSYSVLPIALFYHVAHNGMHLLVEGQNVIPMLSDPMGQGWGWDPFGTGGEKLPPLLGSTTIWILQVFFVIVGHVYGILVSQKTARKLFGTGRLATAVQVPLLAAMILFSFASLWLMHLDMNMRASLM